MTRYRYTVTLEWTGGFVLEREPEWDDDDMRDALEQEAIEDALSDLSLFSVVECETHEVPGD